LLFCLLYTNKQKKAPTYSVGAKHTQLGTH
jgi:hypothetical protein